MIATNVAARGLDIPQIDLIIQLSPPEDPDYYIHRSGRTGRAGKTGTCITLITKWEESLVRKIEQAAKIKMTQVGVPQVNDIINANARDVRKGFEKINQDVLPLFKSTAQKILSKHEPEDALCRALAMITGYTKSVQQRSVLCSAEGFITYCIESPQQIRTKGYMWNVLRKFYAPNIVD